MISLLEKTECFNSFNTNLYRFSSGEFSSRFKLTFKLNTSKKLHKVHDIPVTSNGYCHPTIEGPDIKRDSTLLLSSPSTNFSEESLEVYEVRYHRLE